MWGRTVFVFLRERLIFVVDWRSTLRRSLIVPMLALAIGATALAMMVMMMRVSRSTILLLILITRPFHLSISIAMPVVRSGPCIDRPLIHL
jgi:hypothetical protein